MNQDVTDDRRKEIFSALVSTQDGGKTVKESRELVAGQFDLTLDEVITIERAGIAAKWPPLD